jgi:hypothetical protein
MQDNNEPAAAELMNDLMEAWERLRERHDDLEGTATGGFYFPDKLGEVEEALQAYQAALAALKSRAGAQEP